MQRKKDHYLDEMEIAMNEELGRKGGNYPRWGNMNVENRFLQHWEDLCRLPKSYKIIKNIKGLKTCWTSNFGRANPDAVKENIKKKFQ